MALRPAVFLDKDGTIVDDVPYNVDPQRMTFAPGAEAGLTLLGQLGLPLIVVSNQPGVALQKFGIEALAGVHDRLTQMFEAAGAHLHDFYYCPHHPDGLLAPYADPCACRKPAPGLVLTAAREHSIDLSRSWMVGDILNDVEAGRRAGCRTVLIDNGNETEWIMNVWREPDFRASDLLEAARHVAQHPRHVEEPAT